MKYIAKSYPGIEEATIKEVKDILKSNAKKILKKRVLFETNFINKFLKGTRTSSEVYLLLNKFKFKNQKDIINKCSKINFSIGKDFVVRCSRSGKHRFKTPDIEKLVGEVIHEKGDKVNLNSKEVIYIDIEDKTCLVGKLLAKDLCKRPYRLYINNQSINPCLASSLIKISKIKATDTLVDPFCKDAVIPIEACLMGIKKVHAYDPEDNNIRNAKINSKLAKAKIKFSVLPIDWLDTKFKKNTVKIITSLPFESKRKSRYEVIPLLKEFFHQAKYVAKNPVIVLTQKPKLAKELAKKENFRVEEKKTEKGESKYSILILTK